MLRIIAARNQYIAAGFRSSTAGDGYGIVQLPRAQQRINSGLLYLTQYRDPLRRVLLLENRNVRIIEKALLTQLAFNQQFSLFD